MTQPFPALGLDDIRRADPDRDRAEAFEPNETWWAACDAINAGHKPADVAALLLTLPDGEAKDLRNWWRDECRLVANQGEGRDALCADLLLCRSLDAGCANGWYHPVIDPVTVLELLDERDMQRAALECALTYLGDDATDDSEEARATRAVIRAALGGLRA